jgi:hypothetical protein
MSTICKLDPTIRQERQDRRTSRRFFGNNGHHRTDIGVMCIAIHDILVALAKDPRRTGAQKQRIARKLEQEFEANMAAAKVQS